MHAISNGLNRAHSTTVGRSQPTVVGIGRIRADWSWQQKSSATPLVFLFLSIAHRRNAVRPDLYMRLASRSALQRILLTSIPTTKL